MAHINVSLCDLPVGPMGALGHVATLNCQGNQEMMSLFWGAMSPVKNMRFYSTKGAYGYWGTPKGSYMGSGGCQ